MYLPRITVLRIFFPEANRETKFIKKKKNVEKEEVSPIKKDVERIERNLKKFALPERNTKLVLENEEQDVWDTR